MLTHKPAIGGLPGRRRSPLYEVVHCSQNVFWLLLPRNLMFPTVVSIHTQRLHTTVAWFTKAIDKHFFGDVVAAIFSLSTVQGICTYIIYPMMLLIAAYHVA